MKKPLLGSLNRATLRTWLLLFFIALLIPSLLLVAQAYRQMKWEAFHQYNQQADELTRRIDRRISEIIAKEQARPFTDYSFLALQGAPDSNLVQRSPLSGFPLPDSPPGLLGYFQVDGEGRFSTPLLPGVEVGYDIYGIDVGELQQRLQIQSELQQILIENRLVRVKREQPMSVFVESEPDSSGRLMSPPAEPSMAESVEEEHTRFASDGMMRKLAESKQAPALEGQAAFDQLRKRKLSGKESVGGNIGRVDQLKLDDSLQKQQIQAQMAAPAPTIASRIANQRIAKGAKPSFRDEADMDLVQRSEVRVRMFENETDPFQLSLLDSGHFVLYRNGWREGQRYVQGALLERQALLDGVIAEAFRGTALSTMSDLIVAYQGSVIESYSGNVERGYVSSAEELNGQLLHRAKLSPPLGDLELLFSINHLPAASGAQVVLWSAVVMIVVLVVGFYLFYRLAVKQLELVKQQQDFVSAVSHELKTPLTSIRMYGEMLMSGWATEEKKQSYYAFIHDESERLTRLITNVLQLARMTRNELVLDLRDKSVSELLDDLQSKIGGQLMNAGFQLSIDTDETVDTIRICVDEDSFSQVIINLVDNAIKFSSQSDRHAVDIHVEKFGASQLMFRVRDYGPGIPRDQLKKIFQLFYRPHDELTRDTLGTGIGLALVQQLMQAMDGSVDVVNVDPGAEFRLLFRVAE